MRECLNCGYKGSEDDFIYWDDKDLECRCPKCKSEDTSPIQENENV